MLKLITGLFGGASLWGVIALVSGIAVGAGSIWGMGYYQCASNQKVKALQEIVRHLEKANADLEEAAAHSKQLYEEHNKAEAANDAIAEKVVGNPVPGDGCSDDGFLRKLERLR